MRLAALFAATALGLPAPSTPGRPAVFSDQLPDGLSSGLARFAAAHYAGAQKLGAAETDALRRVNPRFFTIQYRLALGLGRHTQVRFGDRWLPEWPARVREEWFYRYRGRRLYQREWGWYVMNTDDASWRAYYLARLRQQVASTHADGAFLDSASVPNYAPSFEHAYAPTCTGQATSGDSSPKPRADDYSVIELLHTSDPTTRQVRRRSACHLSHVEVPPAR